MVRASFINDINQIITNTNFFHVADFDVVTKIGDRADTLQLLYRYDPRFSYVAQIPRATVDSANYKISFTAAPGEINEKENGAVADKSRLQQSIFQWLERLREELVAAPVNRVLIENKRELDAMFGRLKAVEDVAFTREEADQLKADLEKLKEQIIDQIKADFVSKEEQAAKIESITNDVNALKVSVDVLNKPNWIRAATSRFYKWSKDPSNRGLLKDGVEIATKLLTGNSEK